MNIKHVGRVIATGRKCIVAYRTLPGDAFNCLIIPTENLNDSYHDALINLVESATGQGVYEFAEALHRSQFPDGSTMLPSLHTKGNLIKVPTDAIEMTPSTNTSINLAELNQKIAEQLNVSLVDLALKSPDESTQDLPKDTPEPPKPVILLSDEEVAAQYRATAAEYTKEAARLRKEADALAPRKKAK
jgi:hypothetical protein